MTITHVCPPRIRALELEFDRPISVLQDLQGPKIRIGRLDEGKLALDAGETVASH